MKSFVIMTPRELQLAGVDLSKKKRILLLRQAETPNSHVIDDLLTDVELQLSALAAEETRRLQLPRQARGAFKPRKREYA